jgi:hypothetical protein
MEGTPERRGSGTGDDGREPYPGLEQALCEVDAKASDPRAEMWRRMRSVRDGSSQARVRRGEGHTFSNSQVNDSNTCHTFSRS